MDFLGVLMALGVVILPIVELARASLFQVAWFQGQTEMMQSLILRLIAIAVGVGAALVQRADAFVFIPAASDADLTVRLIATGIAAAFPPEILHLFAAWLGVKVGATADRVRGKVTTTAQSAAGIDPRRTYAGWL